MHAPPKKAKKGNSKYPIFITPKETWTRDFCLLANVTDEVVPSFHQLNQLQQAGLGRRRVTFSNKKADHNAVRACLEETFPKLKSQDGAYEFLKAERGGKHCPLLPIPLSPNGYPIDYLKDNISSGTLLYIRPIQSNLPLSKVECVLRKSLTTQCQHCKKNIPLNIMKGHISSCPQSKKPSNPYPTVSSFLEANEPSFVDNSSDEGPDDEILGHSPFLSKSSNEIDNPQPGPSASTSTVSVAPKFQRNLPASSSTTSHQDGCKEKQMWNEQLTSLFPDLEDEEINSALLSAVSVDEAANNIIDAKAASASKMGDVVAIGKILPPKNLDCFLNRFIREHKSTEYEEVVVDRESVWQDALRYYKRKLQDASGLSKSIEIVFKGEDGLDGGAVRSEYFQLVLEEVSKRLFEGDAMNLVPIKDSTKLVLFRLAGMLVVHVIVQDGPLYSIPTIAPCVVETALGAQFETVSMHLSKHHIPLNASTETLHDLIECIDNAKSNDDIQELLFAGDKKDVCWQLINSSHWPTAQPIKMENKNLLIQELVYNELVSSRRAEIAEFEAGLETLGFLKYGKLHPQYVKEILCYSSSLRKAFGVDELKGIVVTEPKSFSQRQALEWLYDYLEDADAGKELIGGSRVKALLLFSTGQKSLPRNGFRNKLQIQYLPDDDEHTLPTASACLQIVRLPTVHSSKKKFFEAMETALKFGALGFPNP